MADDKKRKRASNSTGPSKKAMLAHPPGDITITYADEQSLHPVIAVSKGIKTPMIAFQAHTKQDASSNNNALSAHNVLSQSIILQSTKHPRLDYTAASYASNDNLAHYVAFFDPATSTLQVTPAHYTQLQCVLRTESPPEHKTQKSIASQRIALGQEFGTKKAKKAIASKTVNAITSTTTDKDDVQTAILEEVAEQTGKEVVVELAAQLASKPIPKPNVDASTVEDVYPIGTLIPASDMRLLSIKDWQQKARAEENIPQPHRFTAFRVAALGKTNDISRLKALRYVGLLLQFHDLLKNAGKTGKKVPRKDVLSDSLKEFPDALVDSVRRRFSDEKNELGKWHIENLHTHICALSLFVDQWSTDISNVRDDLKLDNKTMSQYFTELGCKISAMTDKERQDRNFNKAQAATVRMAKLKLPLEFPKIRAGRRK